MKSLDVTAFILVIIGAINWGLMGFFQFDVIAFLFGSSSSWLSRIVYALVGLSGIYSLNFFAKGINNYAKNN